MIPTALRNKKGVTLIEVLIALVILLIVFMGLIQASILSIEQNVNNALRDQAINVAADSMARARTMSSDSDWNNLKTAAPKDEIRSVGNLSQTFTVTRTVTDLGTGEDQKEVQINIEYTFKGTKSSYQTASLVRRG